MNFLAHLTLSYFSPDLQIGNFIGDFVRGRELAALPEGVQRGVLFHRAIDGLTDADADVRNVNAVLKRQHGRYAPVISDIAFDYFLYLNWAKFGPRSYPAFKTATYQVLLDARPFLSPRINGYVNGMVKGDWLELYTTPEGMRRVFDRLEIRLSQPRLLQGVNESLERHASLLNYTLWQLFPRLQQLADRYRE